MRFETSAGPCHRAHRSAALRGARWPLLLGADVLGSGGRRTPAITPTNGQSPRARHAQGPAQISVDDLLGNLLARTSRAMSAVCVYTARSAALCGVALLLVVCAGLAFGADVRTGGDETTPAITPMNGDGHQEESKLALLCSDHLRGTAPVGSSKWGVFVFCVFAAILSKGAARGQPGSSGDEGPLGELACVETPAPCEERQSMAIVRSHATGAREGHPGELACAVTPAPREECQSMATVRSHARGAREGHVGELACAETPAPCEECQSNARVRSQGTVDR